MLRIAFDLDQTLIPYGDEFPGENSLPLPLRFFFRETLRRGTIPLLRELRASGCDLWIYTTSGRSPAYLKTWFLLHGIRLGGVVNCHIHERQSRSRNGGSFPSCSKYPPAFGIDLLIDDSDGVAIEGQEHGFEVLVIAPSDPEWAERIRQELARRQWRK